jgi:pimeloyl-ACP methyl ester carboxylesterase
MKNERRVTLPEGGATTLQQWGSRGPVILCVHGITSSRRSWTRLGERLANEARVFAYDQAGHGDRAKDAGPMTLARSTSDLAAVAVSLASPIDLLIGHSWGGAVAILGGRVVDARRVLAVDPIIRVAPGTFDGDYVDDLRALLSLPPGAREAAIRAMYAGAHENDVAGKLHAMLPMTIDALERLGGENLADAGGWNLSRSIEDFPVPLDILAAGEDSVMSADDLAFVLARGGPNVSVTTFAHEGHNLQRTAFDEFVAIVADRAGAAARI